MLVVRTPNSYLSERRYIVEVLLGEFLGLQVSWDSAPAKQVEIRLQDDPSRRCIQLVDHFFTCPSEHWLRTASLPRRPIARWRIRPDTGPESLAPVPVIYGGLLENDDYVACSPDAIRFGIDLFGGAFFMLSRYEEFVISERDEHERFPSNCALACQERFIDRPVVNEYTDVLLWAVQRLWPKLQPKLRSSSMFLSHDVDVPLWRTGKGWLRAGLSVGADVLVRRDPKLGIQRLWAKAGRRFGARDPYDTFDLLMERSEEIGVRSAFYFICGRTDDQRDGNYNIESSFARALIRRAHERGHEIGLHPSYRTHLSAEQTRGEFETLRRVCQQEGVQQDRWGGRQHYLRWNNPETWRNWAAAGLDYDSTLTHAEIPGFRCGTCYEYPVFDLGTRQELTLRERPLVVMDSTLFQYMGQSDDGALATIVRLKKACDRYKGDFSLLCHNNQLASHHRKRWYQQTLERLC